MMKIDVSTNEGTVVIFPREKVDYVTAPELEEVVEKNAETADSMVIDLTDVEYISSAGLRVILTADNLMSEKDGLIVRNVTDTVKEIFDISGFSSVITIE